MRFEKVFILLALLLMFNLAQETAFCAEKTNKQKLPTMTIKEVRWEESDPKGEMIVPVTLSEKSNVPVTVCFMTEDLIAISGSDYTSKSGALTIPAGETKAEIVIKIFDDIVAEPDETLILWMTNPQGANLNFSHGRYVVIIVNDDPVPEISVSVCKKVKDKVLLKGKCRGKNLDYYRIVAYFNWVYPGTGWDEAYWVTNLIKIELDGTWKADIPIEFDNEISQVAIFVVNDDFKGLKHQKAQLPDLINYKTLNCIYTRCDKYYE